MSNDELAALGSEQLRARIAWYYYVAGLTQGKKRLLAIERTPHDALVISNFYSPVLVCTE